VAAAAAATDTLPGHDTGRHVSIRTNDSMVCDLFPPRWLAPSTGDTAGNPVRRTGPAPAPAALVSAMRRRPRRSSQMTPSASPRYVALWNGTVAATLRRQGR
jgi:hypothetical protein